MNKDTTLENNDVTQLKKHIIIGVILFIVALIAQVSLATIPFYFYWLANGVKDPLFGAISIGMVTAIVLMLYFFRSILFNFSEPEGVELDTESKLAKMVLELSKKANAPMVEKIFISDEFNAHVSTYKSFSHPVGKHYLTIGIQFMSAVSIEELKSTLAHELGHLSKEHTLFSRFIYKVYQVLYELDYVLSQSHGFIDELYYKGLHLYIEKFEKLSYSIVRNHEFQADEFAAKTTSPAVTASMLCRSALVSDWIYDNYWKNLWRNSWQHAVPNAGVIINACKEITSCKVTDMKKYYNQAKMEKTKKGDTHPSLTDRVEQLGEKVGIPRELNKNESALLLLGDQKEKWLKKCDDYWQEEYLYEWQQQHAYMSNAVMRRDLLINTKKIRTLIYGEQIELAQLFETTKGMKYGYKAYIEIYKKDKSNKYVLFEICRILFKLDGEKAERIALSLVKNSNPPLILNTYNLLLDYYNKIGKKEQVKYYKEKFKKLADLNKQRTKSTDFSNHSLSEIEVNELKLWLKTLGDIDFALVYQVNSKIFPEYPLHRLVISTECYLEIDYVNTIWSGMKFKYDFEIIDADEQEIKTIYILKAFPDSIIFGDKSDYI